ncbi:MAG: NAD(+) synthase [Caulobacterales bacterium]
MAETSPTRAAKSRKGETNPRSFDSLYTHGFVRAALASPVVSLADPDANADAIIALAKKADADSSALLLLPELCVSGYAIEDLLLQETLLDSAEEAIGRIAEETQNLLPVIVIGAPVRADQAVYNCAVILHRGRILGVVPKTYLPNYREFYEKRHFRSGADAITDVVELAGQEAAFGVGLIFAAADMPDFILHAEICEDLWAPSPPSNLGAMAGATVLANLSASNITIGKARDRAILCDAQSRRCVAAYLYAAAGHGESTTDLAWDGQLSVYEFGQKLAESPRFATEATYVTADIDVERLRLERLRFSTFRDNAADYSGIVEGFRRIEFTLAPPVSKAVPLQRALARFPFVPADAAKLDEDCFEAYNIQVKGLLTRLQSGGVKKIVIGVSGGLDSTQALLVAVRAMDLMQAPRTNIIAITMPGFATSAGTKTNAEALMTGLGVDQREIDIKPAANLMLKDIGHPFARGEKVYDVTFENVQAGLRTDYLFRVANFENGLVLGTGDLSELALGWCTYGVGDHMSHYNVNASAPKTLIMHLIRWVAARGFYGDAVGETLLKILATEVSPELVPADASGKIQSTEASIGPYALHDFALFYITRFGMKPSKVAFLARAAWADPKSGAWPEGVKESDRRAYDLPVIKKWLEVFLHRFFTTSQFKRSAVPNGPKITSGGALSPRGDWRAPSDGNARIWLAELKKNVP